MNWRKLGFTQKKPREPGVYFISTDGHLPMAPKRRDIEGWDVADVMFFAGSYTNPSDNREDSTCWMIQKLDGTSYVWRRGMWMKGPITPNTELRREP